MPADRACKRARSRDALLAGAVLCISTGSATATPSVDLQVPQRTFGYFIGDTMDATAIISAEPDAIFDTSSLPAEGPISTWIDLRRITVEQQQAGDSTRVILHLQYQSFFDPEEASQGTVPGFDLALLSHGQRVVAHIPGFSFMASPFRHALQPVIESSALQPDHDYLKVPVGRLRFRTFAALGAVALVALALAARLGFLPAFRGRGRPFAAASGRIARVARRAQASEAARDAMLELHRAFDATAGSRVFAPDVESFIARHERFAPLRTDIETFFAVSRDFFFGPACQYPIPEVGGLVALSRRLRRAERAS